MGSIYVIIGGALWGTMGIFVRNLSLCGLSSLEICAVRVATSSLIMALFLAIYKKELLIVKIKDIWCFLGTGVFSLTFFGYCYFTTIQMTSMSVAAVLLYTSPIFVLIFSAILFREKITKIKVLSIVMAIVGCILVTGMIGSSMSIPLFGIVTGLGSGLGYALYSIFGRYALNKKYHPFTITFYSFVFSTIAILFLTSPRQIVEKIILSNRTENIMWVIGIALIATILPYLFYTSGLSKINNSKAAVLACTEPIVATIVGFIVFGETLNVLEALGVIVVLAAIVIINFGEK